MYLGCDPEFTVLDSKGKPVSAHLLGFGDKKHKTPSPSAEQYKGFYFPDGTNVEVNIAPTYCRGELSRGLRWIVRDIQAALAAMGKGYTLTTMAAYRLPNFRTFIEGAPPDVKSFGCSPWWNAYTGVMETSVIDASEWPWRCAGGHMHFGTTQSYGHRAITDPQNHATLVKLFDLYIGLPLAVLFDDRMQWKRRTAYGKAGEYRPQHYGNGMLGIEYRTPPPQLFNHPALLTLFFGVGRAIVSDRFSDLASRVNDSEMEKVRKAINTGKGAAELLRPFEDFYTPQTILALKGVEAIHTFQLGTYEHDPEYQGWSEHRRMWQLAW